MALESTVLRRLAPPPVPPPPVTPARALRLATVRAAQRSISLSLSVLGVAEEEAPLDDLLARLEEGLLIVALRGPDGPAGFLALDAEARAAAIEAQTLGAPLDSPADPRPVTSADTALACLLLAAVLAEAQVAFEGTALSNWIEGTTLGDRLAGPREAALRLPDGRYRAMRLTLDLGAGGRQGLLIVVGCLAPIPSGEDDEPESTVAPNVLGASIRVDAVLHRLSLALADAEALFPGQVLPLPGITVASIRVEAGGRDLGPARLGQMAGLRAIRIEAPLEPRLDELPPFADQSSSRSLLPPEADGATWHEPVSGSAMGEGGFALGGF